jgi:hypothetical protein
MEGGSYVVVAVDGNLETMKLRKLSYQLGQKQTKYLCKLLRWSSG